MTPRGAPVRILIVCMGNICRSPTAEAVLRFQIERTSLSIEVDSAGTENYHTGAPPDYRSIRHARERGYDLSSLRARQIRSSDFVTFDLILAADESNLSLLRRLCPPEHLHKLALFLEDRPLPDPYYGKHEDFEEVLDLVEERVEELIANWSATS